MSQIAEQSKFEKAVTAILFILIAVIGWLPLLYATWREPFAIPSFLFASAALGILSAALIYDTVERLIGTGKGIYAAAIVFSFTPLGATLADSALLPVTMLIFAASAVNWLAVRAEGKNRAFNLAIIGGLILLMGYLFPFFAASLVFVFGFWLALRDSSRQLMLGSTLALSYFVGSMLRGASDFGIPLILEIPKPEDLHIIKAILLQLPWLLWLIPLFVLLLKDRKLLPAWQIGVLLISIAVYSAALIIGLDPMIAGAAATPMLAVSITDLCSRWFAMKRRENQTLFYLPVLISAVAMLLLVVARFVEVDWFAKLYRAQAFIAIFLFAFAIALSIRKLARWNFAVAVCLGLLAGSLWWARPALLEMEDPLTQSAPLQSDFLPFVPALAVIAIAISRRLYGRRMPRAARQQGETYQFSGANFRRFDQVRRKEWIGEPVELTISNDEYSFAIFGDVTGAEFPFTSRRGGYFIYRDLVKRIRERKVDFAVSVGDLSTQAGVAAYRRLRQILRHLPVPLAVSPGNHDLFADDEYQPQYFHSLFGADNSVFTIDNTRFILLNNALGGVDDLQFTWLEEILSAPPAQFTFVFCHKPVIDPREHEFYAMEDREHAARLRDLFKSHKVTAVFSGHIHSLLTHEQDGVTYIISGGGGSKPDGSENVFHYLLADVTKNQVKIRALPIQTKSPDEPAPLMELIFTA